ncbi:DUF1365 domain-containing protein [Plastorhodobacter daqingensis]|uniref:DUF1365 domain-containing protein n=1 Tax=Plastorhodobacter daqingensis TaxID=1387281 RepID=A0ABW2UR92_9RHOB
MTVLDHVTGTTLHSRSGAVRNSFRYGVDYLLIDPAVPGQRRPWLFSRNRRNLVAVHDRDHGGPPGGGRGLEWLREILSERGIDPGGRVLLLAQPRVLGHVFNPVSFWLCLDRQDRLCVVLAEVTNTYGDRHGYVCHHDDLRPIEARDRLDATKVFHVSPFQPVAGRYSFRFRLDERKVSVQIEYEAAPDERLFATLAGTRHRLTDLRLLGILLRRPFGSRRILALIHWQALRLFLKGAPFRNRPPPPASEVSR